jgi:hypothetical protein
LAKISDIWVDAVKEYAECVLNICMTELGVGEPKEFDFETYVMGEFDSIEQESIADMKRRVEKWTMGDLQQHCLRLGKVKEDISRDLEIASLKMKQIIGKPKADIVESTWGKAMKKRLQVFISSTYTDLIEERQAAVEAILSAGHIPAGMELFKSGNETQLDTIKRWIDESDVYMLIFGGRYGSIEPRSGKSYTHVEYEYALEQGKPLFAVVIRDEALKSKSEKLGYDKSI